jgi:hypothetical protein
VVAAIVWMGGTICALHPRCFRNGYNRAT